MLLLYNISITQFKNYTSNAFNFKERVTGICGLNGKGKTNLLDAIYYCCFTKSYFFKTDQLNVQFEKDGFRLEAYFEQDGDSCKVVCIHRGVGKKELFLNDVPYEKFSKHIGRFPVVMIAPDDIDLITGGSEARRQFMDLVLCQIDSEYLHQLMLYNKILLQRNSLLKRFAEQGKTDWSLLEVIDEQFTLPGKIIHLKRSVFTGQLIPMVRQFYHRIADNTEEVSLGYESHLNEVPFEDLLNRYREKDILLQRCNTGIHKDDIRMQLNGQFFKTTASQGQRKSMLFALKLAEFELLKRIKGFAPLLLLDDVFEKLDDRRMHQLLRWVCIENEGQVFITDTHRERLEETFSSLHVPFQLIEL